MHVFVNLNGNKIPQVGRMAATTLWKCSSSRMASSQLGLVRAKLTSAAVSIYRALRVSSTPNGSPLDRLRNCEASAFGPVRVPLRSFTSSACRAYGNGAPPLPPLVTELQTAGDMRLARTWGDAFARSGNLTRETRGVELAFARSSGPGGQVCLEVSMFASAADS